MKPDHYQVLVSKVSHGTFSMQEGTNSSQSILALQEIALESVIVNKIQQLSETLRLLPRTELTGNIDVGENTENALAAKAVTSVKAGWYTTTYHV